MLTANGKALCKINNMAARANNDTNNGMTLKTIEGVDVHVTTGIDYNFNSFMPSLKLYAGSDNTPVVDTDYKFNNGNLDNLGLTDIFRSGTNDATLPSYTQNYIAIFNCTFRNDTENDIVVNEIGIIGNAKGPSTSKPNAFALIARDVIDTITIAPGEAYTFTMYIG